MFIVARGHILARARSFGNKKTPQAVAESGITLIGANLGDFTHSRDCEQI
ncbi:MAG: hypothetical protein KDA92_04890 [Planctomycetales bacterium]|nr:hypothetical protein [Planctomycetales bacterium]